MCKCHAAHLSISSNVRMIHNTIIALTQLKTNLLAYATIFLYLISSKARMLLRLHHILVHVVRYSVILLYNIFWNVCMCLPVLYRKGQRGGRAHERKNLQVTTVTTLYPANETLILSDTKPQENTR